ncbi:MAG: diguanylate cyclase, partial [Gammaproteobacteria bacterium]|nr:diguanylate cyclase [Gammaproteobacteria bacterium]
VSGHELRNTLYPYYVPKALAEYGSMVDEKEAIVSDIPWAVAWYADRASIWQPRTDGSFEATDYHRVDGLPHDEGNFRALQVDGMRRIWLGTLGGLGVFTPQPVATGPLVPAPLVVESLKVDLRTILPARWSRPLELGAGKHDVMVEMALRTGEREGDIRYRSQMLGLEKVPTDWSAENSRSFTALPPGDYRLRLEARDAEGVMAEPIELAIAIPMPFWRTPPALLALAAAGMLLLYVLLRLREGQQRRREHQLVGLVRQRTLELETRGLELRRINEELTRLSYHDPLTDLANRRMLLERLHGEWELAQARGTSLAFVLFDLDQFKAYNDQRGHLAGDDCLREIGRRIDAELPDDDATAGRYGGEEFGVVMPGLNLEQAIEQGERIRLAVENANLSHPATPQGVVTISVGVAALVPRAGYSAELLIAAADAALYRAKAGGKNRVEAAGSEHY